MPKFSDIAQGAQARKPFEFTLPSGTVCKVALALVLGEAEATVLKKARDFAKERGVDDPRNGDPLYELGIWVHTIALGVVDPDSPPEAPLPFFDGGPAQILNERTGLGREWIALLFGAQQGFQDELAPPPKEMGAVEFFTSVLQIVEAPPRAELPFFRWRRVLQDSFLRMLCGIVVNTPPLKSSPGAASSDGSASSKSSAKPPTPSVNPERRPPPPTKAAPLPAPDKGQ